MSTSKSRFQAVIHNGSRSNMMADENEAIAWAKDFMTKNPSCTCVRITKDIALVERDPPLIKVTPLPSTLPAFFTPKHRDVGNFDSEKE